MAAKTFPGCGWINIAPGFASYPRFHNLHFSDKKDLAINGRDRDLETLYNYLTEGRKKYEPFIRQKKRFPSLDAYAAFQPFNEAFKAMFPLVAFMRDGLKKGDRILNLWDRSGWTASMLAGWFPEQEIITVWEGDKDILGYRGFEYWMSPERRERHTVVFADLLRPLPFDDNSISAVVALDALHRFHQPELISELHRICTPEACMVFPHVHLTNSMPDPFFERGCRQLHGNDYQFLFDNIQSETHRKGFVLSEPGTFMWNETASEKKVLLSEPNQPDYNGCIAWLPENSKPYLKPWRGHEENGWKEMYLLQNPLLTIEETSGTVSLRNDAFRVYVDELLDTHPIYVKRIADAIGSRISNKEQVILYLASQAFTIGEVIERTNYSEAEVGEIIYDLYRRDIAQAVPVDEAGFRLQHLLGQQQYLLERKECSLPVFWKRSVELYQNEPWLKQAGEEPITYRQGDELVELVQKALLASGVKPGDKILLAASMHTELVLTFWAAVSLGIIVVPVSPNQSVTSLRACIDTLSPTLVIAEPAIAATLQSYTTARIIMLDLPDEPGYDAALSFENWLEVSCEQDLSVGYEPQGDDIAVILHTTGSTNHPKAIPLTHAQVIRSGRIITETYHWKKGDAYLAFGGMETMSGLRHATVALAETGAIAVIPPRESSLFEQLDIISSERISILTGNPMYFRQLSLSALKDERKKLKSLRLCLCTGNSLRSELKNEWKEISGVPLYNYYGLTETSGICIAEPLGYESAVDNNIGMPVDCLIKLVDEDGIEVPAGARGELCIYSVNVFAGYLHNDSASRERLRDGWFHTGDLAVRQDDGSLALCGRLSDIVKLPTGARIDLRAIEEILEASPEVSDWAVCPVVEWEKETTAVFIVPGATDDVDKTVNNIRNRVSTTIGEYAVPRIITTVESIPRGNHNKVLKKELLDVYFNRTKTSQHV